MEVNYTVEGDVLIVFLAGEIDHHVAEKLRTDIDCQMDFYQTKDLLLDFSHVSFMDSSGIGVIFGRYKKVQPLGGTVRIRHAGPLVKRILDMAGVFTLAVDEDVKVDNER